MLFILLYYIHQKTIVLLFVSNPFCLLVIKHLRKCSLFLNVHSSIRLIRRWVFWQGLNPMQPPRLSCNSFWYLSSSLRLSGCCFDNFPHHTDDRDAYLWFYQLFSFLLSSWCLDLIDWNVLVLVLEYGSRISSFLTRNEYSSHQILNS